MAAVASGTLTVKGKPAMSVRTPDSLGFFQRLLLIWLPVLGLGLLPFEAAWVFMLVLPRFLGPLSARPASQGGGFGFGGRPGLRVGLLADLSAEGDEEEGEGGEEEEEGEKTMLRDRSG